MDENAELELRRLALIRGASTATEAREMLAQFAQPRLDRIDAQARLAQAEGRLTGELAVALLVERVAILGIFAELDHVTRQGREALRASGRLPGG